MNDTLKVAGRIGAELGAAKAENEKLRELLRDVEFRGLLTGWEPGLIGQITAALSQQAEPTDTFTAVDMATAAAQGFRDGQAAVEQAPAQDEREAFEVACMAAGLVRPGNYCPDFDRYVSERVQGRYEGFKLGRATRPAQTEQQPVTQGLPELLESVRLSDEEAKPHGPGATYWNNAVVACQVAIRDALYTAPIAQTAPQGKFRMGDLVKKSTGSEWVGRVVGWYSTEQTPEGYAVESSAHRNSVQIYPVTALEAVE